MARLSTVTWLILKVLSTLFPSVTNVKIKRFLLIHISQIISQTNRSLDQWNLYGLFSNMHGLFSSMYMDIILWAAACIHCKFKVSQFPSSLIDDLLTRSRQLAFQVSFFNLQLEIENWTALIYVFSQSCWLVFSFNRKIWIMCDVL